VEDRKMKTQEILGLNKGLMSGRPYPARSGSSVTGQDGEDAAP